MSSLYAHFYVGMPWTALPLLALFLFLGTFVAVVIRVSLASRRQEIDAAALLPFDDREIATGANTSPELTSERTARS